MSRASKNSILCTFAGTAGRSASLPFEGGRPDCRPSHRRSGIDGRRSRCWLLRMLLVEAADQLLEVLNRWQRFPSIFFFRVTLPCYQIVQAWELTWLRLAGVDGAIPNSLYLVLLAVAGLQFCYLFVHPLLPCGVLLQQWHVKNIVDLPPLREFEFVGLLSYWM